MKAPKESTVQAVLVFVRKQCAAPGPERDCLGKPVPLGQTWVHGRYIDHLEVLRGRGLVDYFPAKVGWRVVLTEKGKNCP